MMDLPVRGLLGGGTQRGKKALSWPGVWGGHAYNLTSGLWRVWVRRAQKKEEE